MNDCYDPIFCPKCHQAIDDLNLYHKNNGITCHSGLKTAFVYLLKDCDKELLKIGFTINLDRRLTEIKNANTNKIKLLAAFHGTKYNEKILQNRWAKLRYKGEWFSNDLEIEDYFANHPRGIKIY